MYLAAAPYFQARFADNKIILARFQPAITSICCVTNLICIFVLTQMQSRANYPRRIISGLSLLFIAFGLLSISTVSFRQASPKAYFVFLSVIVFSTSIGTGLFQNGTFSFASSFGRPEYIQAIMTGQGVAGILPAMAQIISVLSVPESQRSVTASEKVTADAKENTTAAFTYFVTALILCVFTLLVFTYLLRKQNRVLQLQMINSFTSFQDVEITNRQVVSIWTLYKKLHFYAASVFLCLALSMFYPVFTERIVSVIPEYEAPRLLHSATFIPLGFLSWNIGDLLGRLMTLGPLSRINFNPAVMLIFALLRGAFLPLYYLCNIGGHGAVINSDAFYLIFVSGGFGLTNGILSSMCLLGANKMVDIGEREATSGFMIVNLMAGLMTGSLLSFIV